MVNGTALGSLTTSVANLYEGKKNVITRSEERRVGKECKA